MNKKLVGILAVVLTAGCLTGCGSSDEGKALKDIKVDKYVTLGEYKGVEVTVDPISVDETQLNTLVSNVYNGSITAEDGVTDRAVEIGDTVNIDYVGKKDDVAFDGGTAQGASLTIGSGQFIDGFEDGLIGVMPGDTVDLKLTFPTAYSNAELAGQAVVFTVTVNYIVPTEMTDEAVATFGIEGVTTVEGLEQFVYDYLYSQAESTYNNSLQGTVLETVMENCSFEEMPESMLADYEEMMRTSITQNAESIGVDVDTFTQYYYNADYETFVTSYAQEALRQDMVLQAIANLENLSMNDEELNAELLTYANNAGYTTVEEFVGDEDIELYRTELINQKVMQFLVENAVINE